MVFDENGQQLADLQKKDIETIDRIVAESTGVTRFHKANWNTKEARSISAVEFRDLARIMITPLPDGPTCGPDGKQLAPETFASWIAPGIWADTNAGLHIDVPELLRLFCVEDTSENRQGLTMVAEQLMRDIAPGMKLEVRP